MISYPVLRRGVALALALFALPTGAAPMPPVRASDAIRVEEDAQSKVMQTTHFLVDRFGPRLTGSPAAEQAARWAVEQLRRWGLSDAHIERWDFGHAGWTNIEADGYLVAPVRSKLEFAVSAWTPGTHGWVRGQPVQIVIPTDPTAEQLDTYWKSIRSRVAGRIVLVGKGGAAPADDPIPYRFSDAKLADILNPNRAPPPDDFIDKTKLSPSEVGRRLDAFLRAAGAILKVSDAQRPHGLIGARRNDSYEISESLPSVTLRNEDFGRISRLMADGKPVTLAFRIVNQISPAGGSSPNVIAEIPGSDKRDEVVMVGAHLDSWHVATGATDDGVGCAIMMEAVRILAALRVHPRRTIRIALWTGEEQGLLGSQDYVARHFGTSEAPKAAFETLDAYLNIDGGTGRVRAVNVFGPPAAAATLSVMLKPFTDLGVAGAVAHRIRSLRGTDATTFSRAGLPAIGLIQDPIEYGTVTWHTNLDTFDAVLEGDARQASVIAASLAYDLAMSDERLSSFPANAMPPAQGPAPVARPLPRKPEAAAGDDVRLSIQEEVFGWSSKGRPISPPGSR